MFKSARWRTLLGLVLFLGALIFIIWLINERRNTMSPAFSVAPSPVPPVTPSPLPSISPSALPNVTASPAPSVSPSPTPVPSPTPEIDTSFVGRLKLIVPVAGVSPDKLIDTFADARAEGRTHDAIDIPAAAGTPVLAAADGETVRLFQSEAGGTTIYQLSADRKLVFYYAHLQGYADGLVAGKFVRQGEVIGYVGDTGNAGPGNYHLHFSIAVLHDPNRYWEGTNINPYPILRGR